MSVGLFRTGPASALIRQLLRVACVLLCVAGLAIPALAAGKLAVSLEFEDASGTALKGGAADELRTLLKAHVHLLGKEVGEAPALAAERNAMVRRAQREVSQLLATVGYFSAESTVDTSQVGQWQLRVQPGPQTTVAAVELQFDGEVSQATDLPAALQPAQLRAGWQLPVGAAFQQSAWDGAKQAVLDTLGERRFAAARIVSSSARVDPASATARLSVRFDSGPAFRLGELQVDGLQDLPDDLVARYSRLEVGDLYDRERLLAFQTSLQNTPYFASVIVDIERDPALAAAVPVRVHVTEAKPKYLGAGIGMSTNTGFRVEGSYRNVNFLHRAWELSTGLRFEQKRQLAYADILLPPAGRDRDSFGFMMDNSDLEGLKITSQTLGATRTTTRGDIETQLNLRYQHEGLQPKGGEKRSQNTLSLNWSWTQRKVDDLLDPRAGYVLQVQFGGGTESLIAERDFFRSHGRLVRYLPVGERDVLILRGEAGITLADSREGVPQDFLFRTGGAQTVRGYAYQSLGVKEGRATVGGRYLAVASAEYVRWFRPDWGIASFIDAGDAADSRTDFDLRTGYGLGARWRSPAGPIALDLAWAHDEQRLRLHFGVAMAF